MKLLIMPKPNRFSLAIYSLYVLLSLAALPNNIEAQTNKPKSALSQALDEALEIEKNAGQPEYERAKAARRAREALEAKRIAENKAFEEINANKKGEYEKIKYDEAQNIALRVKALFLAQSIAVKSLDVTDENVEALLARESHALNKINNGKNYDPYIYKALYEASDKLNGKFNSLQDAPEGVKRIGTVRAICVKDSAIYSTGSEGYLLKWKNKTFEQYEDHKKKENLPLIINQKQVVYRALLMTPDGKHLIRAGEGTNVEIFDPNKVGASPRIIRQDGYGKTNVMLLMPDNRTIIFATSDGRIQIANINAEEAKTLTTLNLSDGKPIQAIDMAITADGKYLFIVAADATVPIILDLGEGGRKNVDLSQKFAVSSNSNKNALSASAVAASPNGRYVAMGYSDGTVRIWDFAGEQKIIENIPEAQTYHAATIHDLAFSNDSRMLGVASMDQSASLWQMESIDENKEFYQPFKDSKFVPIKLTDHAGWVMSVAFSEKGDRFYTGTQHGVIKIWETNMDVYANNICNRVNANLSDKAWRKYIGTDDQNQETGPLYILLPNGAKRVPSSTCGEGVEQLKD